MQSNGTTARLTGLAALFASGIPKGPSPPPLALPAATPASSSVVPDAPIPPPQLLQVAPEGFIHEGSLAVFGSVQSDLYTFDGPVFGHRECLIVHPDSITQLLMQVPHLKYLTLTDVRLVYNEKGVGSEAAGSYIQGQVALTGKLAETIGHIESLFGLHETSVPFKIKLFDGKAWNNAAASGPFDFVADLGVSATNSPFADGMLTFTINQLIVNVDPTSNGASSISYRGQARLCVDTKNASTAQLPVDYSFVKSGQMLNMSLTAQDTGPHAFGVSELRLQNLVMTSSIDIKDLKSSFTFNLTASLVVGAAGTAISLVGSLGKDDWSFTAVVASWTIRDIIAFHQNIYGGQLATFNQTVLLTGATLKIAKGKGFNFLAGVQVEGHNCASACVTIDSLGLAITGSVNEAPLLGPVRLENLQLNVFVPSQTTENPHREVQIALKGTVKIANATLEAGLWIDRLDTGKIIRTVYGVFDASFVISDLMAPLKGSFVDEIALKDVCLVWTDGPDSTSWDQVTAPVPKVFQLQSGLQVAAILTSGISRFDKAMNNARPTTNMTLKATHTGTDFEIEIVLAIAQTTSLKSGQIKSGDVSIILDVHNGAPVLKIVADFNLKTPHDGPTLQAYGEIMIGRDDANLSIGFHDSRWPNPFGISPKLVLGPDMALEMGGVYASAVWPSTIGLDFELQVGRVKGHAALLISDDPTQEVILLEVDELGMADVIAFAGDLFNRNWVLKNDDLLNLELVKLYLSSGASIGSTVYPAGASFECKVEICGKQGSINGQMDKATGGVTASGKMQTLDIGPIELSGSVAGTDPTFDFAFGETARYLKIDGGFHILPLKLELDASFEISLGDSPEVKFSTEVDWGKELKIQFEAQSRTGSLKSFKNLSQLEFDVGFTLEQDILHSITALLHTELLAAKRAVDYSADHAQALIEANKTRQDVAFQARQQKLLQLQADRDSQKKVVQAEEDKVNAEGVAKIKQLQANMDAAARALDARISVAEDHLRRAQEDSDHVLAKANQELEDARRRAVQDIGQAQQKVQQATNELNAKFGSAERDLDNATQKLNALQDHFNRAHFWEKIPLKAGLEIAKLAVAVAEAIVKGPAYAAARASLALAQTALAATTALANAGIRGAQEAVDAAKLAADAPIQAARKTLDEVKLISKEATDSALAKKLWADAQSEFTKVAKSFEDRYNKIDSDFEALKLDVEKDVNKVEEVASDVAHEVAQMAVAVDRDVVDTVIAAADFIAKGLDFFDITKAEVTGDLRGFCRGGSSLQATISGSIGGHTFGPTSFEFIPGNTSALIHQLYTWAIKEAKELLHLPVKR